MLGPSCRVVLLPQPGIPAIFEGCPLRTHSPQGVQVNYFLSLVYTSWLIAVQSVLGLLKDCLPNGELAEAYFPLLSPLLKLGVALWPAPALEPARRSCGNKPYIYNEAAEKLAQVSSRTANAQRMQHLLALLLSHSCLQLFSRRTWGELGVTFLLRCRARHRRLH
jgi:hypothetical protein